MPNYFKRIITVLLCLASISLSFVSCRKIAGDTSDTASVTTEKTAVENTVSDTSEDSEEEKVKLSKTVSLYMVGDILLHERVCDSGKNEDGTYNFDHLFENVKNDIQKADIALVNQEVILGGKELGVSGYPCFNGPTEVGDSLVMAGFDIILHATNHALDKGKTGITNCISFWKTNYPDITFLGINETQDEQNKVFIKDINGIKIAFLNYTYGTNGIPLPDGMPYAVNMLDEAKIKSDLDYAESNADFTVVCPHWGTEYIHTTDSNQNYWANIFVSNGADLIIGTHPHVIEPVEEINGVPVYYSLGNYVNSTAQTGAGVGARALGAAADIILEKDENGKVSIKEYGVIPLVCHIADGKDLTVYRLSDYTEDMASKNFIKQADGNFSLSYCKNLCKEVFADLYKEN